MTATTEARYELRLNPLRFHPELTASIVYALKWSLGAMFADPFRVRDVIVAVREIVDNLVNHADWEGTPAPSFTACYEQTHGSPRVRLSTTNRVRNTAAAEATVRLVQEHLVHQPSPELQRRLMSQLVGDNGSSLGGIGLLQVASSPRCRLQMQLEDDQLTVQVDVDVPELAEGRAVPIQSSG